MSYPDEDFILDPLEKCPLWSLLTMCLLAKVDELVWWLQPAFDHVRSASASAWEVVMALPLLARVMLFGHHDKEEETYNLSCDTFDRE
jgi:hypothetical protein